MSYKKISFGKFNLYIDRSNKKFAGNAFFYYKKPDNKEFQDLCNRINEKIGEKYSDREKKKRKWMRLCEVQIDKIKKLSDKPSVGEKVETFIPEEITTPEKFYEGATIKISVNVYERNPLAREKCIQHYGLNCSVCGFNFQDIFGKIGEGFIHVHHLKELSKVGKEYNVDPIEDLRPVCPNCHAMLHQKIPVYSIEELKNIRKKN